jgi:hypothetical protein
VQDCQHKWLDQLLSHISPGLLSMGNAGAKAVSSKFRGLAACGLGCSQGALARSGKKFSSEVGAEADFASDCIGEERE